MSLGAGKIANKQTAQKRVGKMDYQLLAISEEGSVIGTESFGAWIELAEGIETMKQNYPLLLAVVRTSDFGIVWQRENPNYL